MSKKIFLLLVVCGLIASASAQENSGSASFNRFTYSIGGPFGIGKDDAASYVGNSVQGTVAGGINFTRMFGADVEYMYYNLGFRDSVKNQQALENQSGRMQSVSVDGVVNVPRHLGKLNAYGIFGVGFYRRSVSIPSRVLAAGTVYQPAWRWWDIQRDILGNIIPGQVMSSNTKDAGGFNFGGGITYPLNHLHNSKLFLEYRYHRAYQSDGQTIVMPIAFGLRW